MLRLETIFVAVVLAIGAVLAAENSASRLEGDASLVNVDSQKVRQVVVFPGAQPTTATMAGDEANDMDEDKEDGEGAGEGAAEGAGDDQGKDLSEEDDVEENEGGEVEEEEDNDEEDQMEDEALQNEQESDAEDERQLDGDVRESVGEEDDPLNEELEKVDEEEQERGEEEEQLEKEKEEQLEKEKEEEDGSRREEEEGAQGEDESQMEYEEHGSGDEHNQEGAPLVNVDARDVHQVVVAVPRHGKLNWLDTWSKKKRHAKKEEESIKELPQQRLRKPALQQLRKPAFQQLHRPPTLELRRPAPQRKKKAKKFDLKPDIDDRRTKLNHQLVVLNRKLWKTTPQSLTNPQYRETLQLICKLLKARIGLEEDRIREKRKHSSRVLDMLVSHYEKQCHQI